MKRQAHAHWEGDLKQGKGQLSTDSEVLNKIPYSFTTRFEGTKGTNPEELIAAAHAGCFTMALSAALSKEGYQAESLDTTASVSLEQVDNNWTVTTSHLELKAKINNIEEATFEKIALGAKENCPISRLLKAKIDLDWTLN